MYSAKFVFIRILWSFLVAFVVFLTVVSSIFFIVNSQSMTYSDITNKMSDQVVSIREVCHNTDETKNFTVIALNNKSYCKYSGEVPSTSVQRFRYYGVNDTPLFEIRLFEEKKIVEVVIEGEESLYSYS